MDRGYKGDLTAGYHELGNPGMVAGLHLDGGPLEATAGRQRSHLIRTVYVIRKSALLSAKAAKLRPLVHGVLVLVFSGAVVILWLAPRFGGMKVDTNVGVRGSPIGNCLYDACFMQKYFNRLVI